MSINVFHEVKYLLVNLSLRGLTVECSIFVLGTNAHYYPFVSLFLFLFFCQDLTKYSEYSDDGETIPYLSDLVTSLVKVKEVFS